MNLHLFSQAGAVLLLSSAIAVAQVGDPQQHPAAAQAMSQVILKRDFGAFKFDKGDFVTIQQNNRVPGLHGLAFVKYKAAGGNQIMLSIQWFEDKEKLQAFFESGIKMQRKQQPGLKTRKVAGSTVWANGAMAYYWTDGRNFMVSMGGAAVPPEMAKAYLDVIPSRVTEMELKR